MYQVDLTIDRIKSCLGTFLGATIRKNFDGCNDRVRWAAGAASMKHTESVLNN
jgi:hypothetical protein